MEDLAHTIAAILVLALMVAILDPGAFGRQWQRIEAGFTEKVSK